jgi:large subunit ribosomal protein L30
VSAWVKVTLKRSRIGSNPVQRRTLDGLGLGKISSSVVRPDTPAIRGMVQRVIHLVDMQAAEAPAARPVSRKDRRA